MRAPAAATGWASTAGEGRVPGPACRSAAASAARSPGLQDGLGAGPRRTSRKRPRPRAAAGVAARPRRLAAAGRGAAALVRAGFQQGLVVAWGRRPPRLVERRRLLRRRGGTGRRLAYLDRLLQVVGALQRHRRPAGAPRGYSNGGMLAYRYACGRPGRIARRPSSWPARTSRRASRQGHRRAVGARRAGPGPCPSAAPASARSCARRCARAAGGAAVRAHRCGRPRVVLPTYAHGWPTRTDGYDATGEGWRFLKSHPKPER
jgi:hypothetical protein